MNDTTLSEIDALIASFEKNTYVEKHVISLLNYLLELDLNADKQTISAIVKVLGFCRKDFVKAQIIASIKKLDSNNPLKASLLTTCWESGLDYSNYLDVFVDALINGNEPVAIEAYTIIMEFTEKNEQLKNAIEAISNTNQMSYSAAHRILINDSLQHLINLYNS